MKYKYSIFQAEEGFNSLHGAKIGKIIIYITSPSHKLKLWNKFLLITGHRLTKSSSRDIGLKYKFSLIKPCSLRFLNII